MDTDYGDFSADVIAPIQVEEGGVAIEPLFDPNSIRDSIIEKVNSILWLDKLVAEDNAYQERLRKSDTNTEKCMICTLPHGTCEHTAEWIRTSYEQRTRIPDDEDLDKTINDMLSVMGEFKLDTKPVLEDIDLDGMQWKALEERPTDKIGATNVCLFSPDERGWHSTIKLTANLILVFGGLKYRVNQPPPLFTVEPHPDEVEFLNDIRAYDAQNLAWYGVRARGKKNGERDLLYPNHAAETEQESATTMEDYPMPEGRYGHIAAALDENRMMIFGGRGADGRYLRDTWVYYYDSDRWQQVRSNEQLGLPLPRARCFSACVSVPIPPLGLSRVTSSITCQLKETDRDVYMFGGTTATDYFGDLWVFRGSESQLRWEPLVAVGIPPSPRFGHQMVVLYDEKGVEANHYQNGGQQLMVLGGCTFRPQADMVGRNLVPAELSHQVHTIAGSMAATKKAKQAQALLDVHILSITELIWRSTAYPGIKGTLPSARMHFSAACIFRHVFVFGGLEASALRYKQAEADGQTTVYVLDMATMLWKVAIAVNSPDHLKEPLRIAQADVIRAIRRCDEEKLRGLSLGALNGKTIELAEAQCVLEVCKWRQSVLLKEQMEHTSAPPARWGASLLAHGQRLIYIGGWEASRAVPKGKSCVLNVEQEHERRRRLDDEYSAKLSRDRIRDQAEANMANVQSIYELRAIRQAELDNQAREQRQMTVQDLLSSLPPLYQPDSVQLVKANRHTIWVKWPRLLRNSKRKLIDPDTVTYFLYMRVGFDNLGLGDRVFATVPSTVGGKAPSRVQHHRSHGANTYTAPDVYFDDECKRFPAEITRSSGDGHFDLLFDDGTVEKDVPRHRLNRAPPLNLSAVLPSLLSRPSTAESAGSSRPGTAESANSASSKGSGGGGGASGAVTRGRGMGGRRSTASVRSSTPPPSEERGGAGSPGRSPSRASPGKQRRDAAAAAAAERAAISAALLAASAESAASEGEGAAAVVPLEFAANVRSRIQQRQRQRDRALGRIDKVFRGVRELTKEEIAELNRQSRRSKRQQQREAKRAANASAGAGTGTASSLTTASFDSLSPSRNAVGSRGSSGGAIHQAGADTFTYNFGTMDELLSFGEPVDPQPGAAAPSLLGVVQAEVGASAGLASAESRAGPPLTVKVDPRWRLVYVGNDTDYSCTNLVPEDVLEREPDLRVPVSFCYQVHGADEPYYERSQLSTPVIFFTHSAHSAAAGKGGGRAAAKGAKAANKEKPRNKLLMRANTLQNLQESNNLPSAAAGGAPAPMSKTKKEIVTALIAGHHMVQIEKLGASCLSHGVADQFL